MVRQNHRRGQRELEQVGEPRALGPMRSHKGELCPRGGPELREHTRNDGHRKPGDRPRTGETRPCLLTWDPGMVRSISNNDDFLRSQINQFGPAIVCLKTETRSSLVTTLNVGAGEGETRLPQGRCWSPGGTAEPGGWRATPTSAGSPEPRC